MAIFIFKESLRPPSSAAVSNHSCSPGPYNNFHRSAHNPYPVGPPRIVYNDLCFPKTSNYGSMKMKKNKNALIQANMAMAQTLRRQQQQQGFDYAGNEMYA